MCIIVVRTQNVQMDTALLHATGIYERFPQIKQQLQSLAVYCTLCANWKLLLFVRQVSAPQK